MNALSPSSANITSVEPVLTRLPDVNDELVDVDSIAGNSSDVIRRLLIIHLLILAGNTSIPSLPSVTIHTNIRLMPHPINDVHTTLTTVNS